MPDDTDHFRELMRQIHDGSEAAAWELVQEYGQAIRRAVRRALHARIRAKFDSLDFVQIVWNSFFRARDRLEQFERPEQLAAFLLGMARNKVAMEVRRRFCSQKNDVRREQPLHAVDEAEEEVYAHHPAPIDVAIVREKWDRVLRGQPEHYRKIIALKLQGYTCEEIAGKLGLAPSTIRRFFDRLFDETPP